MTEKQEKSFTISIDNKEFTIKKLNLGMQLKLAKVVGEILKGTKMNLEMQGEQVINIDIGQLFMQAPERMTDIISIGLGISIEEVERFEDDGAALEAFEKILELNPITEIIKKSTTLLQNIQSI